MCSRYFNWFFLIININVFCLHFNLNMFLSNISIRSCLLFICESIVHHSLLYNRADSSAFWWHIFRRWLNLFDLTQKAQFSAVYFFLDFFSFIKNINIWNKSKRLKINLFNITKHHIHIKSIEEEMITFLYKVISWSFFTNKNTIECIIFSKMLNHNTASYFG